MPNDLTQVLKDYVATANNPKYNGDWNVINSKFPELKAYNKQVLQDYVATANNSKYGGDWNVINAKFPEFFGGDVKKKEQTQTKSPSTERTTSSSAKLPSGQLKPSQTPLPEFNIPIKTGLPQEQAVSTRVQTPTVLPIEAIATPQEQQMMAETPIETIQPDIPPTGTQAPQVAQVPIGEQAAQQKGYTWGETPTQEPQEPQASAMYGASQEMPTPQQVEDWKVIKLEEGRKLMNDYMNVVENPLQIPDVNVLTAEEKYNLQFMPPEQQQHIIDLKVQERGGVKQAEGITSPSQQYAEADVWYGAEQQLKNQDVPDWAIRDIIRERQEALKTPAINETLLWTIDQLKNQGYTKEQATELIENKTLDWFNQGAMQYDKVELKYARLNAAVLQSSRAINKLTDELKELMKDPEKNAATIEHVKGKIKAEQEAKEDNLAELKTIDLKKIDYYDPITGEKLSKEESLKMAEMVEGYKNEYFKIYTDADQIAYALWNEQIAYERLKSENSKHELTFGQILLGRIDQSDPQYQKAILHRTRLNENEAKIRALQRIYLLNKSPETETLDTRARTKIITDNIATGMVALVYGEYSAEVARGMEENISSWKSAIQSVVNEYDIPLTEEEKKATESVFEEKVWAGLGGAIPMIVGFGAMGQVLGATGLTALTNTLRAGNYTGKVLGGVKMSKGMQKIVGGILHYVTEGEKFNLVGGSRMGGYGFALAAGLVPTIPLPAYAPVLAQLIRNMAGASLGITVGAEGEQVFKALVSEISGNNEFKDIMYEHYGDLDEAGQRILSSLIVNTVFGISNKLQKPIASKREMEAFVRMAEKYPEVKEMAEQHIKHVEAKKQEAEPKVEKPVEAKKEEVITPKAEVVTDVKKPEVVKQAELEVKKIDKKMEEPMTEKQKETIQDKIEREVEKKDPDVIIDKVITEKELPVKEVREKAQTDIKENLNKDKSIKESIEIAKEKAKESDWYKTSEAVGKKADADAMLDKMEVEVLREWKENYGDKRTLSGARSVIIENATIEYRKPIEERMEAAKKKVAEGFEDLSVAMGVTKRVMGQEAPDPIKAIIKIAEGTFDASMVNANRLVNAVKQQAREAYKNNKEALKRAMEFINKNADDIKAIYYANKEPNLPKTEIQKRIDKDIESRPQYSQDYKDLKKSYLEPSGYKAGERAGYKTKQEEFNKFTKDVKKIADEALRNYEISSKDYKKIINQIEKVSARVTKKGFDKAVDKALSGIDAIIDQNVVKAQSRAMEQAISRAEKILKPRTTVTDTGVEKARSKADKNENIIRAEADTYSTLGLEAVQLKRQEALNKLLDAQTQKEKDKAINTLVALDLAQTRASIIDIKNEFNSTKNTTEREVLLVEMGSELGTLKQWNKENIESGKKYYEEQNRIVTEQLNFIAAVVTQGRKQHQDAYGRFETMLFEFAETKDVKKLETSIKEISDLLEPALTAGVGKKRIAAYNKYMDTQFKEALQEGLTIGDAAKINKDVKRKLGARQTYTEGASNTGLSAVRKIYTMLGGAHQSFDGWMHILGGNKKNYEKLSELLHDPLLEGYYKEAKLKQEFERLYEDIYKDVLKDNKELKQNWSKKDIAGVRMIEKKTNKTVYDLEKLSFDDVAYFHLALTNKRATMKLLGEFTENSVIGLENRINDIIKQHPEIKTLIERTRNQLFERGYEVNNETHEAINRTRLRKEDNYFPQHVISTENLLEGAVLGKYGSKGNLSTLSIDASFIHKAKGGGKLDLTLGYDNLINNYILQTMTYSGRGESVRQVAKLLGNKQIKESLVRHTEYIQTPVISGTKGLAGGLKREGYRGYEILKNFVEDYAGVGKDRPDVTRRVNRRIASAILKYNPLIPPKQLVSMTNFVVSFNPDGVFRLPILNESKWLYDNFASWTKTDIDFYKSFVNSALVKDRLGTQFDIDYLNTRADKLSKYLKENVSNGERSAAIWMFVKDMGGIGIKAGDIGAFILGGKANWKQYVKEYKKSKEYSDAYFRELNKYMRGEAYNSIKNKMGEDVANKEAEEIAAESTLSMAYEYANKKLFDVGSATQQSKRATDLTDFQRRNNLSRWIPFSTTCTQYGQAFAKATRNISRGEATYEDVKSVYNYAILQGLLHSLADKGLRKGYNWMYQLFMGDDDKELFWERNDKNIVNLITNWDEIDEKMTILMPVMTIVINQNQFLARTLVYLASMHEDKDIFEYQASPILETAYKLSKDAIKYYDLLVVQKKSWEDLTEKEKTRFWNFLAVGMDAMTGFGWQTPIKLMRRHLENVDNNGFNKTGQSQILEIRDVEPREIRTRD